MSEVALALVLLTGAGLTIKAFLHLQSVDPGFEPENLLTLRVELAAYKYPEGHQREAFYRQILERIETIPGALAAGAVNALPMSGEIKTSHFTIEGRPTVAPGDRPWALQSTVSPDYFRTMEIPLLKGRYLTEQDTAETPLVAMINEQLDHRTWPGEDPIGSRIRLGDRETSPGEVPWLTIVGIVGDVRNRGVDMEPLPEIYVPQAQSPEGKMTLVVRTTSNPLDLAAAVRSEIWAVDKDQPVYDIMSMKRILSDYIGGIRVLIWLLGIFAAVALMLAAVGIYGVMAYSVTQRTHEIGIRRALGAQQSDILKLVMRQGLGVAFIGVAIGLAGASALTRFITELLFGVSPTDPATYAGVSVLLAGVALLACYIPARRATRVDPMAALRYE